MIFLKRLKNHIESKKITKNKCWRMKRKNKSLNKGRKKQANLSKSWLISQTCNPLNSITRLN